MSFVVCDCIVLDLLVVFLFWFFWWWIIIVEYMVKFLINSFIIILGVVFKVLNIDGDGLFVRGWEFVR